MHPLLIAFLSYVVLPLLRIVKIVWPYGVLAVGLVVQTAHFLTGGVFRPRLPIERRQIKTKMLKLYVESNVLNPPFDEVRGIPDEEGLYSSGRTSRTSETSTSRTPMASAFSWMSENGNERTTSMSQEPYFNIAIQAIEEGQSIQYHG